LFICNKIPAEHLEGLHVWNSEDPEPVLTVFDAGNGLLNTDYIIYIQSSYTPACLQGVSTGIFFSPAISRWSYI